MFEEILIFIHSFVFIYFYFEDYYRFFEAKVVISVEESFKTEDFNEWNFTQQGQREISLGQDMFEEYHNNITEQISFQLSGMRRDPNYIM